ncbi:MAG: hypothetical protein ACXIVG_14940 [Pararhodobacter sp.]
MDWAWWATVALTAGALVGAFFLLSVGLVWRNLNDTGAELGIAARSGWWFALAAALFVPAGMIYTVVGWTQGGGADFAASFPRTDTFWTWLIPASFNPDIRSTFGARHETGLTVLTVAAGLSLLMGLYRFFWQPFRWLRAMARQAGVRMTSFHAIKVTLAHFLKSGLLTAVIALFLMLVLQTIFFLLGHLIATAFFLLPWVIGFLVLAAIGAGMGGRDIYDSSGRRIGRLD